MSAMTRLWEKLTGQPHQHHNANMVKAATCRLISTNEDFGRVARNYLDADNPLEMMLRDAMKQRPGQQNERSEPHS